MDFLLPVTDTVICLVISHLTFFLFSSCISSFSSSGNPEHSRCEKVDLRQNSIITDHSLIPMASWDSVYTAIPCLNEIVETDSPAANAGILHGKITKVGSRQMSCPASGLFILIWAGPVNRDGLFKSSYHGFDKHPK